MQRTQKRNYFKLTGGHLIQFCYMQKHNIMIIKAIIIHSNNINNNTWNCMNYFCVFAHCTSGTLMLNRSRMALAYCSPKEGSLRPRTWQRAPLQCQCTERWESRRELCRDTLRMRWGGERERERRRHSERRRRGYNSQRRCLPFLCVTPEPWNKPVHDDCHWFNLISPTGRAIPTQTVQWHVTTLNLPVIQYANMEHANGGQLFRCCGGSVETAHLITSQLYNTNYPLHISIIFTPATTHRCQRNRVHSLH